MTNKPKTNSMPVDETHGSFLRGSSQLILRLEKEIAEQPDTSSQIKRDWAKLKDWLNCPDGRIDPETYNRFALAWQSYFAMGISPSIALDKSFALYKEMAVKENWHVISIPPEIKTIFDRMIATDQDIFIKSKDSPSKPTLSNTIEASTVTVEPALKDVYECLQRLFDGPLKAKGLFPNVAQTPNFPFSDYNATLSALQSGKAHLSFGLPSSASFNAIATGTEKFQNMIGMLGYSLAAPIALIAGAVMSENYWLLLWGVFLFPLAFFGTHPHYKKAPVFLIACMICVFSGMNVGSTTLISVSAFFFLAIAGYSFTRRLYNWVLIRRALQMESALMFLLGCNNLHLCGDKGMSLWTPAWVRER